jgi:ADP-ribose pyrophosphatase YjhB (NUDIX family)
LTGRNILFAKNGKSRDRSGHDSRTRDAALPLGVELDILPLLDEIQTIARNGLNFSRDPYDRERYERLLAVASHYYGQALDAPPEAVRERLVGELGYITPKVGAHAAVFDPEGRILLARRADDNRWCLPCGWVEPNESPEETVVREAQEEVGLRVRADALIGVYTRKAGDYGPHAAIAIGYLCEVIGGVLGTSHEVREARYSRIEDVADWHEMHHEYAVSAREVWRNGGRRAAGDSPGAAGRPGGSV